MQDTLVTLRHAGFLSFTGKLLLAPSSNPHSEFSFQSSLTLPGWTCLDKPNMEHLHGPSEINEASRLSAALRAHIPISLRGSTKPKYFQFIVLERGLQSNHIQHINFPDAYS